MHREGDHPKKIGEKTPTEKVREDEAGPRAHPARYRFEIYNTYSFVSALILSFGFVIDFDSTN